MTSPARPVRSGPTRHAQLSVYVRVIVKEAEARGITVRVLDPADGRLHLSHGERDIIAFDALSELTSAVAMCHCADKGLTRQILGDAGLRVPRGRLATFGEADVAFLDEVGQLVVKPNRGEQGNAVTSGIRDAEQLEAALDRARHRSDGVLLEEHMDGEDIRVIVIDHEVVGAAVRRPPAITGTGEDTVGDLIDALSRGRQEATDGEAHVPVDAETRAAVAAAGYELEDVLPDGESLQVRRTANLHTGGTLHDVTADLHPAVVDACARASRALRIPVVGLDLIAASVRGSDHVFIEANERPGLAFHEPAPVVARYVDLLFPETASQADSR